MKRSFSVLFLCLGVLGFATPWIQAQNVGVTVKLGIIASWFSQTTGNGSASIYTTTVPSGDWGGGNFAFTLSNPGSVSQSSNGTTAVLLPDKVYTISYSATNVYGGSILVGAPLGYQVLVNSQTTPSFPYSCSPIFNGQHQPIGFTGSGSFQVVVLSPNTLSARAGVASSITSGQVRWQVAMGYLISGRSAGALSIADPGSGTSWNVFTRAAIWYMAPAAEIVTYNDSTGLRQVLADQADVDLVDHSTTAYYINFYNPSTRQGTAFPYTHTGLPYVSYLVQMGTTATSLQITSVTQNLNTNSTARTAVTTLTRTPTGNEFSYTWVLDDWNDSGLAQVKEETRQWGGASPTRTENITVYTPNSGKTDLTVQNTFTIYGWGEQLTKTLVGSTNQAQTKTDFYNTGIGSTNYALPKSLISATGTWTCFDYNSNPPNSLWFNAVSHQYKPFISSPATPTYSTSQGEVAAFTFQGDSFNAPTRPTLIVKYINGTTTATENISYTDPLTAPDGQLMVQTATTDNYSSGNGNILTTTTQYYRESVLDAFFTSQVRSVINPDGSQVSYAYQRGTFNNGQIGQAAFTANTSGTSSSIAVITGSAIAANGSICTSYNGFTIDKIYLVSGKSTMQVTLRDSLALVRSVQSYAWVGGSWVLVGYTNYTYDASGQLQYTYALNGATTSTVYNGEQVTSTTDPANVTVNYTYDHAGRVSTAAKSVGPTTTYGYDSLGHVLSQKLSDGGTDAPITNTTAYDDAGRLTSETPAGLQAVQYGYSYGTNAGGITNATYARTTTYPDTGTRIEAQQLDGRPLSVSGTAVVEQDYTYAVESSTGYLDTTASFFGASPPTSGRWATTVTDWLGRIVSTTHPGFSVTSQPKFVQTNVYDTTGGTGHLIEVDRAGYAPLKYQYDAFGSVILSGMDLGNDNLALPSNDIITASSQFLELYNGNYWLHEESDVYPKLNSITPSIAIKRTQLTGFPANCFALAQTTDVYGNVCTQKVVVNPAAQSLTTTTTIPGVTNSRVETVVNGLRTQVQDVNGLVTYFGYDGLERPKSVTDSRANTTTTSYLTLNNNSQGTPLIAQVVDATGAALVTYDNNSYDGLGRPIKVTNAGGYVAYSMYNVRGQLIKQWGNAVHPVMYGYDTIYGDRTSMTTYQGDTTTGGGTEFTGSSWPSNASSYLPCETQWSYDAPSGLLCSKMDPANKTVIYTYNAAGQTYTRTWARPGSIATKYIYDTYTGAGTGTGQLMNVQYSDGTPNITYAYTRSRQLQSVTDATGQRTFNYNTSQPLELDSVNLASSFYSGWVLNRQYNSDSLLPGRSTGFLLSSSTFPSANLSQTFKYSGLGYYSSLSTACQGGANSVTFNYGYLPNAPLVSSIALAGNSNYGVTMGYEAQRNLLTSISNSWNGSVVTQFNYGYNPLCQRFYSMQSGSAFADYSSVPSYDSVFNNQTYDSYGQLKTRAMYRNPNGPPAYPNLPSNSDMLPARSFQFAYDAIGNRQESGENVWGNAPYSYDSYSLDTTGLNEYFSKTNDTVRVLGNVNVGATVSVNSGNTAVNVVDRNFGGDFIPPNWNPNAPACGSLTPIQIAAAMPNNSPTTIYQNYFVPARTQQFFYDYDGNLSTDGVWTYSYDAENRLSSMTNQLIAGFPSGNETVSFTYDYLNRRVEKKAIWTGTQNVISDRRYIYDGNNLVAEIDTSGKIQRSYTWGLDLAGSLDATGGVGALLEITNYAYSGNTVSGTTNYFTQFDGNGNVAALVRSDGLTAAVYEYGPFGEPLRNENFDLAINDNAFRFSTKFLDTETGLVNYGNRYYSPTLGRFINRDPIEEAGGLNLYGFCGNDGINRCDILGNSWLSKLWDRTVLSLGRKIAINWDHQGRSTVEAVVIIVVSIFVGEEADGLLSTDSMAVADTTDADIAAGQMGAVTVTANGGGLLGGAVTSGSISATTASTIAAAGGGAAAGFVGGAGMSASAGQNGGQILQAGLNGAAFGAITGGAAEYFSGAGYDQYISRFMTGALRGGIETGNIGGAFRGGLVNELPTDLWLGSTYYNNPFVNFAANEVRDAAQGYAINGQVGAERSVFGSLANDAVGHLLGLFSSGFSAPTFRGGVYMYPITSGVGTWLSNNFYGAITFGNVVTGPPAMINAPLGAYPYGNGFGAPESAFGNDPAWTAAHEIDHFQSQNILGAYYLPLHALSQGASQFLGNRAAYLEQWPFKDLPYGL